MRAVRPGPHERLSQRQPINTNVQKATNRGAEYCDENCRCDGHRGTGGAGSFNSGAAVGSVGRGHNSESSATPISPVSGSILYGVSEGSSGRPGTTPAAVSCSHDVARCPVRFV